MGRGEAIDVEGAEALAHQLKRPPTQANVIGVAEFAELVYGAKLAALDPAKDHLAPGLSSRLEDLEQGLEQEQVVSVHVRGLAAAILEEENRAGLNRAGLGEASGTPESNGT